MGKESGTRDNAGEGLAAPDYRRQTDIFNPNGFADILITIVGLGNIGSHTARALAQLGLINFQVFDFDEVEAHNLSSQAYFAADVGKSKVESITEQMLALNPNVKVQVLNEAFNPEKREGNLLISAVDSMHTRRNICNTLPPDVYVIDGRMGGGQIEVWSQPAEKWGATLTRDGDEDPCSARYISYTSYIIAGLITNQVKRHLMGQKVASRILAHVDTLEMIVERE